MTRILARIAMNRRCWPLRILFLVVALVLLTSNPGHAAAVCTASVNAVNFGAVSLVSGTNTDVQSTLFVNCSAISNGRDVLMCPSINIGTGGWNGTLRTLNGPANAKLAYEIFQDAAYSQPWGSLETPQLGTVPGIDVPGDSQGNGNASFEIYGRVPGAQVGIPPGSYYSNFSGVESEFRYGEVSHGHAGTCDGFTGTAVTNPTFDIVAAPPSSCIFTVADLNFPTSMTLTAAVTGQTTLEATCTGLTTYSIALDNGLNGTSPTARVMKSASSASVTYGLYRDSLRSLPWGTLGTGQAQSGTGTGAVQSYTIYGQVPAQPTATAGTYTDRIVVTVTY